jgi:hypothetical protein
MRYEKAVATEVLMALTDTNHVFGIRAINTFTILISSNKQCIKLQ